MNKYELCYDMVMDLQKEVLPKLYDDMGQLDTRMVGVLSAAYTLQDYFAGKIAEVGATPEGEEEYGITWENIVNALG